VIVRLGASERLGGTQGQQEGASVLEAHDVAPLEESVALVEGIPKPLT
jgi:hypothetical protein